MVAEIPSPGCVGNGSPFAGSIASARAKFDSQFTATSSFQSANVPVQVTGVGFFDFAHGQHGAAPNVIELHPILDIVFTSQTDGGADFSLSVPSSAITIAQGGSSSTVISTTTLHGPPSDITFSTSGLPSGVSSHFTPVVNGKSTLTVTASAATSTGASPITITGTAGGKSHSQIVTLNVSPSSTPITQEWEYQLVSVNTEQEVIDQANKLGSQEWELVSVAKVQASPAWKAFFKRIKRDF